MSNLKMKDFDGNAVYLKMNGLGTDLDPHVPIQDVNIQDQITRPLDFFFTQIKGAPTTVAVETAIDDQSVTVVSDAVCSVGDYFGVFEDSRFYFGEILALPGGNVIDLDTPLDSVFTIGSTAACFSRDMDVNGSITPQIFQVEVGSGGTESIDITRIIFLLHTATTPEFADFGDISGGLTMGLVLRRVNGSTENILNWKSNAEIANTAYDLDLFGAGGLPGGAEGFVARLSFAGQEKHGVALRLGPGDKIQMIIQDDLTTLTQFRVVAQGHVVE